MSSDKSIKLQIKEILEFSNKDAQLYLKDTNPELYKYRFESNFPEFSEKYPTIIKKIISGDDLKYLDKMLDAMENIQNNTVTKEEVEKELGEELATEYIYPLINKKK
jgi:transcription antitermination factor NusA-like protein